MTSDDMGITHVPRPRAPTPGSWSGARPLDQLLEERGLVVTDVVAGAAPGTRRLYVADVHDTDDVRFAVAVPHGDGGDGAVANEATVLSLLHERLPAALSRSVPEVVEWVLGPAQRQSLVVTAVAGLDSSGTHPANAGDLRRLLVDTITWLESVWQSTSGDLIPVELGRGPVDLLLSRYRGAANVRPAIGALLRARGRVAQVEVVSTATHGCLAPRHLHRGPDGALGVDDWGLGSTASDPLRDLGRVAVDLASHHLPEVVVGRTALATEFRHAVCRGLEVLSVSPRLWRDVLLLAQFEAALSELARGEPSRLALLQQSVHALPIRS
jgi:hypothetical protein